MRTVDHAILDNAKVNKKDEFYTQLIDIEKEMVHYTKHFIDKIVYCNCDLAGVYATTAIQLLLYLRTADPAGYVLWLLSYGFIFP